MFWGPKVRRKPILIETVECLKIHCRKLDFCLLLFMLYVIRFIFKAVGITILFTWRYLLMS